MQGSEGRSEALFIRSDFLCINAVTLNVLAAAKPPRPPLTSDGVAAVALQGQVQCARANVRFGSKADISVDGQQAYALAPARRPRASCVGFDAPRSPLP
jgi:hypothetical protein